MRVVMDLFISIQKVFAVLLIFHFPIYNLLPNKPYQEYHPYTEYNISKLCSLRGAQVSQLIWNNIVGYNCYKYTNVARFTKKYECNDSFPFYWKEGDMNISLPIAEIDENTIALFNYHDIDSLNLIRKSFMNDEMFENYEKCCSDAEICCNETMTNENIIETETECPVVWDAWSCFPKTPVNTTCNLPCSSQAYQSPDKVCTLQSQKECYWNESEQKANWNQQTDYSTCLIAPVYLRRHNYHVIFLYVSVACSLPAIIIFLAIPMFRQITRVILHRNLLIAIALRNILTIIFKKTVIIDALLSRSESRLVMEHNSVICRLLSFFVTSANNATYACMLADGYYLHKVIVRTFAKEPHQFTMYGVVFAVTFLPSLIWASIMASRNAADCWAVDMNGTQWSVDSFRIVILSINTILLLHIISVMVSKMKQGGTTRQTMAAVRATVFLIPLFGLHIFITAKKIVINDSCSAEDVYDYFRYTMEGLQGIFVALLFCYANSEVQNELQNILRKCTINLEQRFGIHFGRRTMSRRRTTAATYVQK